MLPKKAPKKEDWQRGDFQKEFLEQTHFNLKRYNTVSSGNKQLDNSVLVLIGPWIGPKSDLVVYSHFKAPRSVKSSTGKDLDYNHVLQLRSKLLSK